MSDEMHRADKRSRVAAWVLWVVAALGVYVLSWGPVAVTLCGRKPGLPESRVYRYGYAPLIGLVRWSPWCEQVSGEYYAWCMRHMGYPDYYYHLR